MSAPPARASLFPVGALAPATAKSLWADFYDYAINFLGAAGHGFDGPLLAAPRRITVAGTADAMTATLAPAITSYTTGMRVTALLPGANTIVNPTLNLNALGAKTVKKRSGTGAKVALVIGDYNGTLPFEFEYDGTDCVLLNPLVSARADIASAATLDLSATSGTLRVTGTTTTTAITLASGQARTVTADGAWPLTHGASLILPGAANYTCAAGDALTITGEPAGVVRVAIDKANGQAVVAATNKPSVRQTVLAGPVDASGLPNFGGATGSATVTASGTLTVSAAAGAESDYTGSIVNPSWTGLSTDGTMFLYLDITAGGVVTTGSTTLEPTYQHGGAYSTTNGQHTYNIQEGTMKAGNGSTAAQVYRTFVGKVTVAGGVVTAITWYALLGRYMSKTLSAMPDAGYVEQSHNIGVRPAIYKAEAVNVTTESGYVAGDTVDITSMSSYYNTRSSATFVDAAVVRFISTGGTPILTPKDATGGYSYITAANWNVRFTCFRGW